MVDLTGVKHHPAVDAMVGVICNKTQNTDRGFFDVEAAFFLSKMAACQRVTVVTKDRGEIPVNQYVIALGSSGTGKGYSVGLFEDEFLSGFRNRFLNTTFPVVAEDHLWKVSNDRAIRNGTDQGEESEKLLKEFRQLGPLLFTFDSGTVAAVKQMRQKLLLASCGSINFQMDEMGSNLTTGENGQVLNTFLELYDQGKIKQKLVKNTNENQRSEEVEGKTPSNMLLFGTPSKLLDGGITESTFMEFLETGYARRCLFGYGHKVRASKTMSADKLYDKLIDPQNDAIIAKWRGHFENLADANRYGWKIKVDREVAVKLLEYKIECEDIAEELPEHEEILKNEISHRYFKALKLAGVYAFIDESMEMELGHLMSAIKMVEQSGDCFRQILRREKRHVKIARYIMGAGTDLTHVDIADKFPFYGTSNTRRNEILAFAQAWAFKNHGIIRKQFVEGIEVFSGETLENTKLDKMILSYSNHMAYNYLNDHGPFDQLHNVFKAKGHHWCNHHFEGGHRLDDKSIPGFNMLVVDVDGSCSLAVAHELMKDYVFMTYTTKRHQNEDGVDRFRMVIPMTHILKLDSEDYKEFMGNVFKWLPFSVDESTGQRNKKWLCNDNATVHYNLKGELLDTLNFVPKTSKNEAYARNFERVASLENLERWFADRMQTGSRNNHFIRYALALVESGVPYPEIEQRVLHLNSLIQNPLSEDELRNSVLITASRKSRGEA